MYQVLIEKRVEKKLAKIPPPAYAHVKKSILQLAVNPGPNGCKKLKSLSAYRIRLRDFRIIHEIKDQELLVLILDAGHRSDIYK